MEGRLPHPHDALTGPGHCGTAAAGAYQDRCGYGPRLPLLVISPYAKVNSVAHTISDQTSILRFIEDNWNLGTLGKNDAHSTSIRNAFDFNMKPRAFHKIPTKYPVDYFLHQPPSGRVPDTE